MVKASGTSVDQQRGFPVGLTLFLTFLHIVNQIDRQLVAAFAADIMRDLDLNRSQFALIAGLAFSGVYAFAALFAGILADRLGRVKVLSGGLSIWSLFTALAGLAQGFWTLLAARPFVAAGEATLIPTASNIILAKVGDRHKAGALGLFFAGIPLGIGGGFLIAGLLGPLIGWRGTFLVMGAIGIVSLAVLVRLRDAPPDLSYRPTLVGNIAGLMAVFQAKPRALWASLAIIFAHCHTATGPFVQLWLVSEKNLDPAHAQNLYGLMFVIVGLAGTFGAGLLGDWAQRRLGWDHARTAFLILLVLGPLLPLYRLSDGGSGAFLAVRGCPAGLLYQKRHGVCFVHQTELRMSSLTCVRRIQENSSAFKNPMNICDHRCGPPHIVVLTAGALSSRNPLIYIARNSG